MGIGVDFPHFAVELVLGVNGELYGLERLLFTRNIGLEGSQDFGSFFLAFHRPLFELFGFLGVAKHVLEFVQLEKLAKEIDDELVFGGFERFHTAGRKLR